MRINMYIIREILISRHRKRTLAPARGIVQFRSIVKHACDRTRPAPTWTYHYQIDSFRVPIRTDGGRSDGQSGGNVRAAYTSLSASHSLARRDIMMRKAVEGVDTSGGKRRAGMLDIYPPSPYRPHFPPLDICLPYVTLILN